MLRRPVGKARKRKNIWIFRVSRHSRTGCIGVYNVQIFLSEPYLTEYIPCFANHSGICRSRPVPSIVESL
jgi:hypothetical protein